MTITTAKTPDARPGAARLPTLLKLAPLALGAMLLSAECRADWRVLPRIDLRETYSDNIGLASAADARGGFVTESDPTVSIISNGSRLKLNLDAGLRNYAYSNDDIPNLQHSEHHYNATAQGTLVEQLLYLDAGASGSRQAVSAFGPISSTNYSTNNSADVSTWHISPYLRHRFGSTADMTLRYQRDSVDSGVGGFGSSMSSTSSADISSGSAFNAVGWTASYYRQDLQDSIASESSSQNASLGLRWNLLRRFSLTSNVGYDKYSYPALDETTKGASWSAGFVWTPSTHTRVQASFGRRYFGKTGSLDANYRTQRSVWNLTYSDAITTSRSQFLLPAAVDTAAMLDGLFAASFPDPTQRQQAVQAYIAANGLPTALLDSVNYLSNRYFRDKRLQGSAVFRGSRSSLSLSLFSDVRNAVSLQQSDSTLLQGQLSTLNDNTQQRGASANVEYRLSTRTSANAAMTASRVRSLSTGIATNNTEFDAGLSHRFSPKIQGNVNLRHTRGSQYQLSSGNYRENALVATMSVQY